ncbi:MAG: Crp/Fnr family transcriptional regulator [Roseitalea sp.]|jgi:CRP/FNR family transcriptional regulator|uniref:Crp/Fnr family transcriptional regulator n=1 Tax=Oceaniradius stylonematis TaxID=2184161 RepID=A0A3A8ADZ5_9HYPH|nr:Crp/Fnr family transcriptional regulator [Oceaniradius stylonematis]MBO6551603.1 Crp/Fnr family transcriptional regulator [Roseitalea sp.]MBO6952017.1 Crp/Fnr family transcriptional regulator [Rhizobiaceae bacterium]MBO6592137.1 Crp/Fnr family transcriptional regulator [Roseitalea sp.]MBO6598392.1 Crp/Fnr family transcriptional regulator [Roseitalea sp.]MBO6610838.1 Crp/Fnr family transcriptional regulator [Roseitalea sp.]
MAVDWLKGTVLETAFDAPTMEALGRLTPGLVPKGTILFRPGEAPGGFALVLSGRINVYLNSRTGRELRLYSIEPGETCLMTTLALLGAQPYSGEAIADTDVVAAIVPFKAFRELMDGSDRFRQFVFRAFAERIGEMTALLEMVAFQKIEIRLARWLLDNADDGGRAAASHAEIATAIGSAREVVSRHVEKLSDEGIVEGGRKEILIRDRARLAAIAGT